MVFFILEGKYGKNNIRETKKFAQVFLKSGNSTQAYIQAGYKKNRAHKNSTRLLNNLLVKEYIKSLRQEVKKETIASIQEIKEFLTEFIKDEQKKEISRQKASEILLKTLNAFEPKKKEEIELVTIVIQK